MKNQQGFSLIELILYMGLTSVLIGIMSQVFLATLAVRVESANTSGVQQDGRFIMARLAHDVRKSDAIVSPELGIASSSMSLVITETSLPDTYVYNWDGQNISIATSGGSMQLNSNRSVVTNFSLTRIGNSGVVEDGKDSLVITLELVGNSDFETSQQILQMNTTVSQR